MLALVYTNFKNLFKSKCIKPLVAFGLCRNNKRFVNSHLAACWRYYFKGCYIKFYFTGISFWIVVYVCIYVCMYISIYISIYRYNYEPRW